MNKKGGLMKKFILLVPCALCLATLIGCASIKETAKGIAGVSTKVLEENRKEAITRRFAIDYSGCYKETMDILRRTGSYVYADDASKGMIAVYISSEDTTPVGVFLKVVTEKSTQVEVSSPSTYGKELIAGRVFSGLENKINPVRKIPAS